ncbi:MAG: iron-containing redox enzyme family protein [Deltaproteobacteria bacterium]|nr:iron-containing redox enzyme family protein [Deltaproteobacteria bacterium]
MSLSTEIDRAIEEFGLIDGDYFTTMGTADFPREQFVESQIQYYRAVEQFSRVLMMAALRLEDVDSRTLLLDNVWEEHGEGDARRAHIRQFGLLLFNLGGITTREIEARRICPEVMIFNSALFGLLSMERWPKGLAALGVIERMFIGISSRIGNELVARGWIAADTLTHYNLHAELDVKHANDLFHIVERHAWDDQSQRGEIIDGLRFGAALFGGMYQGIFTRRATLSRFIDPAVDQPSRVIGAA